MKIHKYVERRRKVNISRNITGEERKQHFMEFFQETEERKETKREELISYNE